MLEINEIIEEYLKLKEQREQFKDGDHMSSVGYLALTHTMSFIYTKFDLTNEIIENYEEMKYNGDKDLNVHLKGYTSPKLKDNC